MAKSVVLCVIIALRNQLPLKQGLRLFKIDELTYGEITQKPTSTKTRIKTHFV